MSRLVRYQLVAFAVIAVLGVVFVGAKYIHLDHMLGFGQYQVKVKAKTTANLSKGAEVTYRGVPVGRVDSLDVTPDGVMIYLELDSGKPKVPAGAKAVIANRSAIGEQYMDLVPDTAKGPYLRDGSVIDGAETPIPVEDLLASVNHFSSTTDLTALSTTVTELGKAFDGQGDNLRILVDSLNKFSQTGIGALPQTVQLIRDAQTVLGTQADQSPAIRTFSDGLDRLAVQLRANDPDIRRLIGTGADAGDQIGKLLDQSAQPLTTDLSNLRLLLQAVSPQTYTLKPLLQMLPLLSVGGSATAPGDGTTHFGLVLETNNPPACTVGYEGTQRILDQMKAQNPNFDDTRDDFPFNTDAKCTVPFGSPTDVRGGARAQYADPNVPQPWDSKPKTDPDKLNLSPVAIQLATLIGVTPKR
ncbi:mammalian cell entry protein [Nocardia sp. 852002-20019_SCH5090214]|jgi:phospholipid/cholesterol/gamma-HCH transport system substrate-binding protein|uniref:MCE family protein n=1 Tax=Nocardia nova TaxID=37330 RepID=A0A2S5ZV13_9NOCA|nr:MULTISPECIES: MlaD family protein [Nocardia]OBF75510.1 mammalian cell entry protein [Mycobacterium sp. 852002-51759_SCH5129042]MBF6274791.1 MCE family protein [Nocardia nova]MBV7707698.1 MCE family protein [Nocardia nova]OBA47542.1 mammalian cell entry protein [Nocardia sp. 852002-51101_SCH5132738]OBA64337.1 mammalian cell entry protein [Nocardia sp. 852002-20019_SCH5090214]